MPSRRFSVITVLGGLCSALALLGQVDAAEKPLHERIDRLIAAGTADYPQRAAPVADDAEFLRRVYLDLTGTIPTTAEARQFLKSEDPAKRRTLIDRLLDSPEYARHMQRRFDVIFMQRLPAKNVKESQWEAFLRESFAANKPYDQLVREILAADGSDSDNRGPARFYLGREGNANKITRAIGRVFLGADLKCAQCHDHPEVGDWSQEDYYGISAFLVRSFVFQDKKKKQTIFAEKAKGEVSFESVFDIRDGVSNGPRATNPHVFDGPVFAEPAFMKDEKYEVKPNKKKNVRPIPRFSRRALLPKAIANAENEQFARTAANRLWALLMGRGLIHPVDYDHLLNPPSHPELLTLLRRELVAHDFNIKWYLRQLALSKTYQRSSRTKSVSSAIPPEETFAQAIMKPLTPAQFAWAMLEATGEAGRQRQALGDKLSEAALYKKLRGYEKRFVKLFGGLPGKPPEDFQSTVDQVLYLSGDPQIMNLIKRKNGNLADRMLKLPAKQPKKVAEELFLSALSRPPSQGDVRDVEEYLKGRTEKDRQQAVEELIWAVLTSAEFRFNH